MTTRVEKQISVIDRALTAVTASVTTLLSWINGLSGQASNFALVSDGAGSLAFKEVVTVDSNHAHSFDSLTSKPTTVAGYGITDAVQEGDSVTLTGDVTGSAVFDASGNVSITTVVADDSHAHLIANVDGLQTALDGKASSSHVHALNDLSDVNAGAPSDNQVISWDNATSRWVAASISALPVGDADTLDGLDSTAFELAIGAKGTAFNKNFGTSGGTVAEGNHSHTFASLTSKPTTVAGYGITDAVQEGDSVTLTGDVTGTAIFDANGNISITTTVVDDSHAHIIANIDGLQTALDGKSDSAHAHTFASLTSKPTTVAGYGITDAVQEGDSVTLTGDVTGSAVFDASGNVSITTVVADDSHAHLIANVDGLQTALDGKASTSHVHALNNLSDVNVLSPSDNQVLSWDGGTNRWIAENVSALPVGDADTLDGLHASAFIQQSVNNQFYSLSATTGQFTWENSSGTMNVTALSQTSSASFTARSAGGTNQAKFIGDYNTGNGYSLNGYNNGSSGQLSLSVTGGSVTKANIFEAFTDSNNSLTDISIGQTTGFYMITIDLTSDALSFYGNTPIAKPTVTGSQGGNAALSSLITALSNLGLITDSTS